MAGHPGLEHLRVRRRGDRLTIESGPEEDPIPHARMGRVSAHLWILEMPTHTGRFEATPYRDLMDTLWNLLVTSFPWALAPLDNPQGTSDPSY